MCVIRISREKKAVKKLFFLNVKKVKEKDLCKYIRDFLIAHDIKTNHIIILSESNM